MLLGAPLPAAAQGFGGGSYFFQPSLSTSVDDGRLRAAAYLTLWQFPGLPTGGGTHNELHARPSSLLTLDYFLTPRLSIGGWWNPYSADLIGVSASSKSTKLADVDGDFWNASLMYHLSRTETRDWAVQAGYSALHYGVDELPQPGFQPENFALTRKSANLWLHYARRLKGFTFRDHRYPVSLFGSAGYYFSEDFNHSANLLLGSSIDLNRHLSLSSSVWLADLANLKTRFTFGLSTRY
jgi:hypothetical protein